ncbi:DUF4280 domain-containing protein [Paenibacillus pinihumi]|uniref:DUF4280 domain-containing protein n=1 Tax=Paenibacillus pinihumi TaxID=669462 RepID=UPI00041A279A|nr:DUF4280 domain-containing protein [Paenibacillus pinihumi]
MFTSLLLQMLIKGLGQEEYSYVVREATLKCSEGTHPGMLNLPACHGVYILDKPVMNVADCVPVENVSCFGFCNKTPDYICKPEFTEQWTDGKEDVLVGGQPALLSKSKLICKYSGIVTIEDDGQLLE